MSTRGSAFAYGRAPAVHGKQAMAAADKRPSTYGAARVCATEDCETILSSYNPSPVCCLHSQGWTAQSSQATRNRRAEERPELSQTCQNSLCSAEFVTTNPSRKYCSGRCRMQTFQRRVAAERSAAATTRLGMSV